MYEVIGGINAFARFPHAVLVENISFDNFGTEKPSGEPLSVASKAANRMAGFEQARHEASADISRGAGYQNSHTGRNHAPIERVTAACEKTVTLSVYARSIEGLGRQAVNELARSLLVTE
jgi:hypothetical protein